MIVLRKESVNVLNEFCHNQEKKLQIEVEKQVRRFIIINNHIWPSKWILRSEDNATSERPPKERREQGICLSTVTIYTSRTANEREYFAQVFFFLVDLLPDTVSNGVDGLDSTFCTSSIPRFYEKKNKQISGDKVIKKEATKLTFPFVGFNFASSVTLVSSSFSIIPNSVLHLLCNSCGDRLLKNQSNRKTGNSVISFLILSYTSSACIP